MSRRRKRRSLRNNRQRPKPVSLWRRIFRNRYNPGSNYVTLGDIIENMKSTWYAWTQRVPPGSRLIYRDGKVRGHTSMWPGRR
jgi:hypothetical protein